MEREAFFIKKRGYNVYKIPVSKEELASWFDKGAVGVLFLPNTRLTFKIENDDASSFTLDAASGLVTFKTPLPDYESGKIEYKFKATVTDDGGSTDTQDVTISINNLNDNKPIFTSKDNKKVDEGQTSVIKLEATDKDVGDTIAYSISDGDSSEFSVNSTSGVITFNAIPDYEGTKQSYTFKATATDSNGSTAIQNMSITLNNINDNTPLITNIDTNITVEENQLNAITLTASDEDNKIIEWVFTWEQMLWSNDKNYPIPVNYASKSKMVQWDKLKLIINWAWKMTYKQIEPIEREIKTGLVTKDQWKFQVVCDWNTYDLLTAAITHFKVELWDSISVLLPKGKQASFAAIEAVIPKEIKTIENPTEKKTVFNKTDLLSLIISSRARPEM